MHHHWSHFTQFLFVFISKMGKYHSSCLYSKLSESEPKFEKTFKTDKGIFLKNSDPDQNLKCGHGIMFTIYVPWHREYKYFVKKENNFYYHKNLKRIWRGIKRVLTTIWYDKEKIRKQYNFIRISSGRSEAEARNADSSSVTSKTNGG